MSKKEKVQVHGGYPSSVFSADTSSCTPMSGALKKKNSKGMWQKRYFYLNNDFLIYKGSADDPDIKGAVDLNNVTSVSSSAADITIVINNGDTFPLRGSDNGTSARWVTALRERMQWLSTERELASKASGVGGQIAATLTRTMSLPTVTLSGWLMKKSPHKYVGLQERFVRISEGYLAYYKSEGDAEPQKRVCLETAEWVRPYDSSDDCTTFELRVENKVLMFVAESAHEMQRWVRAVEQATAEAKERLEAAATVKNLAAQPRRIRLFDEEGAAALADDIRRELAELYPPHTEPPASAPLTEHLKDAAAVHELLDEVITETQKSTVGTRTLPARLDVLAVELIEINAFLTSRLGPVLGHASMRSRSLGELHMAIVWLAKHENIMHRTYCPGKPGEINPVSCSLLSHLPQLCEWYISGSPGRDGAASHLNDHCLKVWNALIANPAEMLQRHNDGSFYTHAPTDIWEALHQHLSLALSTECMVLYVLVADKIASAMNHVLDLISHFVLDLETSAPNTVPSSLREVELELICGLTNDAAMHFEELMTVMDHVESEEIRNKIDVIFDSVTDNIVRCGMTCLNRVSTLVLDDIKEPLKGVFTSQWAAPSGDNVEVAVATIADYLNDLKDFLVPFWTPRLPPIILEGLVTRYCRIVLSVSTAVTPAPAAPGSLPSERTERTSLLAMSKGMLSKVGSRVVGAPVFKVTDEILEAMQRDLGQISDFFSSHCDAAVLDECLAVPIDLLDMMQVDIDEISRRLISRINQCPPATQMVMEAAKKCTSYRNDLSKEDLVAIFEPLDPLLKVHLEDETYDVTEVQPNFRRICAIYCQIVQSKKSSLARRLLDVATSPLSGAGSLLGDKKGKSSQREVIDRTTSNMSTIDNRVSLALLDDVMEAVHSENDEYLALRAEKEREERLLQEAQEAEKTVAKFTRQLNVEGMMGKKSPAHNLWQDRWFKLSTRYDNDADKYIYTLLWYKKRGGSVLKSVSASSISGMNLLRSRRPLTYHSADFTVRLAHEAEGGVPIRETKQIKEEDANKKKSGPDNHHFSFVLNVEASGSGDKDIILRTATIDELIRWMNALSQAANLVYDPDAGVWQRGARLQRQDSTRSDFDFDCNDSERDYTSNTPMSSFSEYSSPSAAAPSGRVSPWRRQDTIQEEETPADEVKCNNDHNDEGDEVREDVIPLTSASAAVSPKALLKSQSSSAPVGFSPKQIVRKSEPSTETSVNPLMLRQDTVYADEDQHEEDDECDTAEVQVVMIAEMEHQQEDEEHDEDMSAGIISNKHRSDADDADAADMKPPVGCTQCSIM